MLLRIILHTVDDVVATSCVTVLDNILSSYFCPVPDQIILVAEFLAIHAVIILQCERIVGYARLILHRLVTQRPLLLPVFLFSALGLFYFFPSRLFVFLSLNSRVVVYILLSRIIGFPFQVLLSGCVRVKPISISQKSSSIWLKREEF